MSDKEGTTFNYHPAYGLPDTIRIRAVRIAKEVGVKQAMAECNVCQASIYRWLSHYANSAITK